MGDKKPKKNSSGNSDAHKAKVAKDIANKPIIPPPGGAKPKKKNQATSLSEKVSKHGRSVVMSTADLLFQTFLSVGIFALFRWAKRLRD